MQKFIQDNFQYLIDIRNKNRNTNIDNYFNDYLFKNKLCNQNINLQTNFPTQNLLTEGYKFLYNMSLNNGIGYHFMNQNNFGNFNNLNNGIINNNLNNNFINTNNINTIYNHNNNHNISSINQEPELKNNYNNHLLVKQDQELKKNNNNDNNNNNNNSNNHITNTNNNTTKINESIK